MEHILSAETLGKIEDFVKPTDAISSAKKLKPAAKNGKKTGEK
jgi:DtxR family Mn-dependent transcriptional regulator